jgi:hypothetical protein
MRRRRKEVRSFLNKSTGAVLADLQSLWTRRWRRRPCAKLSAKEKRKEDVRRSPKIKNVITLKPKNVITPKIKNVIMTLLSPHYS